MNRNLTSIGDFTSEQLMKVVLRAVEISADLPGVSPTLRGKVVGIFFQKTSTRTRTAFSSGALRLGASIVSYGPNDLQLNTGETVEDTTQVLGSMLDALVIRGPIPMTELSLYGKTDTMSAINAMCNEEHPTQAVADLATLHHKFGRVTGLSLLYVGEGNNTAAALVLACAAVGIELEVRTPSNYGVSTKILEQARKISSTNRIHQIHDLNDLPQVVDVVYTTRWQTTGTVKSDPNWREDFLPFQANEELMGKYPDAFFMHDLPAHRGEEVTAGVLDGPNSIALTQAQFKLFGAMACLEWCLLSD
ncbi:ornithine carbamoyltransferase [Glaciibacter superstes]|uniref:ornithine carbamoyltransferase n=1 Tax=Glaciibacter superstes TaxID=501023 RepID=UPI0003B3848F|nr:ornithine carbamoyltransferase [Glaciibacter superstes]